MFLRHSNNCDFILKITKDPINTYSGSFLTQLQQVISVPAFALVFTVHDHQTTSRTGNMSRVMLFLSPGLVDVVGHACGSPGGPVFENICLGGSRGKVSVFFMGEEWSLMCWTFPRFERALA